MHPLAIENMLGRSSHSGRKHAIKGSELRLDTVRFRSSNNHKVPISPSIFFLPRTKQSTEPSNLQDSPTEIERKDDWRFPIFQKTDDSPQVQGKMNNQGPSLNAKPWVAITANSSDEVTDGRDNLLTHVSRRAMATDFVAILPSEDATQIEVAVDALNALDAIESALTIYQPDSEITQINRRAFLQPVGVSWSTFRLIERAVSWSEKTEGAFDISAGPLVEAWGFNKRQGHKPTREQIEQTLQQVGFQHIELDAAKQTVRFTKQGMSLNLGAIGKGHALDQIASKLREREVNDFLLHGGNSSVIACGDQEPGTGKGWAVGISHPTKPKRRLAGVWLHNAALATSGSGKQFFHHRGQRYGHVIDPRTGYPSGDLQSLTAITTTATDADACATALFVAGSNQIDLWSREPWMPPTVMLRATSRQDALEMQSVGEIPWLES